MNPYVLDVCTSLIANNIDFTLTDVNRVELNLFSFNRYKTEQKVGFIVKNKEVASEFIRFTIPMLSKFNPEFQLMFIRQRIEYDYNIIHPFLLFDKPYNAGIYLCLYENMIGYITERQELTLKDMQDFCISYFCARAYNPIDYSKYRRAA